MDFDDSPDDARFRAEVRAWLDANAPSELEGPLERSGFAMVDLEGKADPVAAQKGWQRKKYDAGWACLHWPREYGGRAATPMQRVIWQQEEGVYSKLGGLFTIGHGMCGPTVMGLCRRGAEGARSCRASRPAKTSGASSFPNRRRAPTSPALRTRAQKTGRENGLSTARRSGPAARSIRNGALLLARTDPKALKHKGPHDVFPAHGHAGRPRSGRSGR